MKAECLKDYGVSLTKGRIYDAKFPPDSKKGINIYDNTGDWYGFPREWFEIIEDNDDTADTLDRRGETVVI